MANDYLDSLTWFSLFDYPLTERELNQWSRDKINFANANLNGRAGFYCLPGEENLVTIRQQRYRYAARKLKKLQRLVRWLAWLPWINFIGLANVIGAQNCHNDGDIDLFVITAPRRVWLTRLVTVGLVKLLKQRADPRRQHLRDTFCLSFFVDDNHLPLADLRLPDNDLYFTYWLANLAPVFNRGRAYEDLIAANPWLKTALPRWQPPRMVRHFCQQRPAAYHRGWPLLDWLENQVYHWQISIAHPALKILANRDQRVVMTAGVIKLHANDRREMFNKKYQEKLNHNNQPLCHCEERLPPAGGGSDAAISPVDVGTNLGKKSMVEIAASSGLISSGRSPRNDTGYKF